MSYDPARKGSLGNRSLLSKYGGNPGSGPAARNKYASGGAVKRADGGMVGDDEPDGDEVMEMEGPDGEVAKPDLSRPGRKIKGKKDNEGKTDINIIIMSGKEGGPPGGPPMPPPGPMAGPPPSPPPGPPPGPPMPMRASGGKVDLSGVWRGAAGVKKGIDDQAKRTSAADGKLMGAALKGSAKVGAALEKK